jgi:hypothetical protein
MAMAKANRRRPYAGRAEQLMLLAALIANEAAKLIIALRVH